MQITESSIYIGLKQLRNKLYQAQFLMHKADRVIYGTPLMLASGKAISEFVLAFSVPSKRLEHLEESLGWFAVVKTDLEFCIHQNIIHYHRKKVAKDKDGNPIEETDAEYANSQKVELFKIVAKIDNDMCKWLASLAKGKTISDKR